jgi:predicted phosphoribosyltransferase
MSLPFVDRRDAGRQLAERLKRYEGASLLVQVLGLPRGGVPVAYEVAKRIRAALDVFVVRKLGVPSHPELAMGAIASGGIVVRNEDVISDLAISEEMFQRVIEEQRAVLEESETRYRGHGRAAIRAGTSLRNTICIIVDDGIATGATMRAAVIALRSLEPASIVVAAPVAAPSVAAQFRGLADFVEVLHTPADFSSVGGWYMNFDQTTDEEVAALLYNKPLQ